MGVDTTRAGPSVPLPLLSASAIPSPIPLGDDPDGDLIMSNDLSDLFGLSPPIDASSLLGSVPTLDLGASTSAATADALAALASGTDPSLAFLVPTFSPTSTLTSLNSNDEGTLFTEAQKQSIELAALMGTAVDAGVAEGGGRGGGEEGGMDFDAMKGDELTAYDPAAMEELLQSLAKPV